MQGRITTADSFESDKPVTLLVLKPSIKGDSRIIERLRASGIRSVRLQFVEGSKDMRIVIPDAAMDLPPVGRGRHAN